METDKLLSFVQELVGRMTTNGVVTIERDQEGVTTTLAIEIPQDTHVLIGKDAQNLKALEHITRLASKRLGGSALVSLDINGYRKSRSEQLTQLVRSVAERVRGSGRPEALDPMTAYERRVVHTELASWSDLATESVGQDPQRRVVIKPL